jgi:hypothetical protein
MQKSLLAEHLLICAMSLVVALASPAYSQQAKHEPKSNAYPDVAYRGAQFWGTHCDRVGTAQTSYEEIYMVHPWINDWQKGGKHQVAPLLTLRLLPTSSQRLFASVPVGIICHTPNPRAL